MYFWGFGVLFVNQVSFNHVFQHNSYFPEGKRKFESLHTMVRSESWQSETL